MIAVQLDWWPRTMLQRSNSRAIGPAAANPTLRWIRERRLAGSKTLAKGILSKATSYESCGRRLRRDGRIQKSSDTLGTRERRFETRARDTGEGRARGLHGRTPCVDRSNDLAGCPRRRVPTRPARPAHPRQKQEGCPRHAAAAAPTLKWTSSPSSPSRRASPNPPG